MNQITKDANYVLKNLKYNGEARVEGSQWTLKIDALPTHINRDIGMLDNYHMEMNLWVLSTISYPM